MLAYGTNIVTVFVTSAELLMSRKLRINIPATQEQLYPKPVDCKELRAKDGAIKDRQKRNYDQRHGVHPLPPLQKGDEVWIPDRKESKKEMWLRKLKNQGVTCSELLRQSSGETVAKRTSYPNPTSQKHR